MKNIAVFACADIVINFQVSAGCLDESRILLSEKTVATGECELDEVAPVKDSDGYTLYYDGGYKFSTKITRVYLKQITNTCVKQIVSSENVTEVTKSENAFSASMKWEKPDRSLVYETLPDLLDWCQREYEEMK